MASNFVFAEHQSHKFVVVVRRALKNIFSFGKKNNDDE